jgi:hypothetical protein
MNRRDGARTFVGVTVFGVAACGGPVGSSPSGPLSGDAGADSTVLDSSLIATDATGACIINASQFGHSCSVDSDCVDSVEYPYPGLGPGTIPVSFGNYCDSDECHNCSTGETISESAVSAYVATLHATLAGSGVIAPITCSCTARVAEVPCCQGGNCMECTPDGGSGYSGAGYVEAGVLCALDGGVIDGGDAGSEQVDVCYPGYTCTQFNGAWRCCFGGLQIQHCRVPMADSGD